MPNSNSNSKNLTELVTGTIFDGKQSNFQALGGFRISDDAKANNPKVFERLKFESIFKRVATMAGNNNILAVSEFKKTPAAYINKNIQTSGAISFKHINEDLKKLRKQNAGEVSKLKSNSTTIEELSDCTIYGCEHNETIVTQNKFGYGGIDPEVVHGRYNKTNQWTLGSNDAPDGIGFITKGKNILIPDSNNLVYTPKIHQEIKLLSLKCSGSGPAGDKDENKNKHKQEYIKDFLKIYLHGFKAAEQGKPGLADAMSPAFKDVNVICGDTNITISKCNDILESKGMALATLQTKRDFLGTEIAKALDELYRAEEEVFSGFGDFEPVNKEFFGFDNIDTAEQKWFVVMSNITTGKLRSGFLLPNGQFKKSVPTNIKTANGRKGDPNTADFEQDGTIIAFRSSQKFEDVCNEIAKLKLGKNFTIYSATGTNNECFRKTSLTQSGGGELLTLSSTINGEPSFTKTLTTKVYVNEPTLRQFGLILKNKDNKQFITSKVANSTASKHSDIFPGQKIVSWNGSKEDWVGEDGFGFGDIDDTPIVDALSFKTDPDKCLDSNSRPIEDVFLDHSVVFVPISIIKFAINGAAGTTKFGATTNVGATTPSDSGNIIALNLGSMVNNKKKHWKPDLIPYLPLIYKLDEVLFEYFKLIEMYNTSESEYLEKLENLHYFELDGKKHHETWTFPTPSQSQSPPSGSENASDMLIKGWVKLTNLVFDTEQQVELNTSTENTIKETQKKIAKGNILDQITDLEQIYHPPNTTDPIKLQAQKFSEVLQQLYILHYKEVRRRKPWFRRGGGSNLAKKISKTRTKGLRKSKKSKNRRIKRNKKSLKKRRKNRSRKLNAKKTYKY